MTINALEYSGVPLHVLIHMESLYYLPTLNLTLHSRGEREVGGGVVGDRKYRISKNKCLHCGLRDSNLAL